MEFLARIIGLIDEEGQWSAPGSTPPAQFPLYSLAFEATAGLEPFNSGTRVRRALGESPVLNVSPWFRSPRRACSCSVGTPVQLTQSTSMTAPYTRPGSPASAPGG